MNPPLGIGQRAQRLGRVAQPVEHDLSRPAPRRQASHIPRLVTPLVTPACDV